MIDTSKTIKKVTYNGVEIPLQGSEDLTSELNTYNSGLTTQEATIEDIISALNGKVIQEYQEWVLTYEDSSTETIRVGVL